MTYRRVRRGQFSFENSKGNKACEVTTIQHGEVCEVTLCHSREEDGTQGEDEVFQAEGEDAMQHSIQQDGTQSTNSHLDLEFGNRWAKIGNEVQRQEQAHDAAALIHALFVPVSYTHLTLPTT